MTTNQLAYLNLQEQQRSNLAREAETHLNNLNVIGESRRHNLATEAVEGGKLSESVRHNLINEQLTQQQVSEQARANVARETENARHNTATEVQEIRTLNEQIHHNAMTEGLEAQKQAENARHNIVNEQLSSGELQLQGQKVVGDLMLGSANLSESERHNRVTEIISGFKEITGALAKIHPGK